MNVPISPRCQGPVHQRCHGLLMLVSLLVASFFLAMPVLASVAQSQQRLEGVVESAGQGLSGYRVTLYASGARAEPRWRKLGSTRSGANGHFRIRYKADAGSGRQQVLFVLAEDGPAMLASAVGVGARVAGPVVVNERTTVATGAAFAQFVEGRKVLGNRVGMFNAAHMVSNMAGVHTGTLGEVLDRSPNAGETRTRDTFNSMANIVSACINDRNDCNALFTLTKPPAGKRPTTVLQAVANMTRYPANHVSGLFGLSLASPLYQPALVSDKQLTSWLLFIKFTGGFYSEYADTNLMNGPGNVAFDKRGSAWINDNYVPAADLQLACAGLRLLKFYPWGESVTGSPFFGGGLSGAGFGITLDPRERVWVGNFGFEAPVCDGSVVPDPANKIPATHDSLSLFRPDGQAVSDSNGITAGHVWWPQATVSDRKGNIWAANCGNDTVTLLPRGKPSRARNIALPGGQGEAGNYRVELPDVPNIKPFAITIDPRGRAWVTGNKAAWSGVKGDPAGRVYRISPNGRVETMPHTNKRHPKALLSWPMGISSDSKGNVWVSNSDSVNVPCVTPLNPQSGNGASIVLYPADDSAPRRFDGGGITIPWGNVVDGNDNLWVFNFGTTPIDAVDADTDWPDTGLSVFCGADEKNCPGRLKTGDAISPDTGYVTDALDRVTGGAVDPSGNLWLMNNWKKSGPYDPVYNTSPGGNSFVIVPGAAGPVKTPLLGAPRHFSNRSRPH